MVTKALMEKKKGKATGPSVLNVELILADCKHVIVAITHHLSSTLSRLMQIWKFCRNDYYGYCLIFAKCE